MRLLLKVSFIVVALGATGLGLLALRQQRYEVSNQISRAHNRVVDQERAIWKMQAEVAGLTDPRDIRDSATKLGIELEPIQPAGSVPPASTGTLTSVTPPTPAAPADKAVAPGVKRSPAPEDARKAPAAAKPAKKKKPQPARKDAAPATRKDATHAAH